MKVLNKVIQKRLDQGKNQKEIAEKLGFSEPTISREINRNSIGSEYWADQAHRLYLARRRQNIKYKKDNKKLFRHVLLKLMLRWSPEQIAGRLKSFADPGSPWQRGLNENTNGLLRQFFPKGSDFKKFNQKELDAAVELLNHRPRKSLGYRTPYEVFFGNLPTEDLALQN